MSKRARALFLGLLSPAILSLFAGGASAEDAGWNLNMPRGVTEVSQAAYDIHMIMIWVCTVIGVLVFGFMFYIMFAHRKSRGVTAANFHENLTVEILCVTLTDAEQLGGALTEQLADLFNEEEN